MELEIKRAAAPVFEEFSYLLHVLQSMFVRHISS